MFQQALFGLRLHTDNISTDGWEWLVQLTHIGAAEQVLSDDDTVAMDGWWSDDTADVELLSDTDDNTSEHSNLF